MTDNTDFKAAALSSAKGLAAAAAVSVILSFIVSAALCAAPDPLAYLTPTAVAILFLSFITGGTVASLGSEVPVISALFCSAAHLLIILICAFLFPNSVSPISSPVRVILYIAAVLSSILASVLISRKSTGKSKARSRSKKYRR